jgi:RNA polymerase sigma-70 factor (ECF subfamily)
VVALAFDAILTGGMRVALEDGEPASVSPLERLAQRARAGDSAAFDRLMIETQARVVAIAWRMLGTREEALDAAQDVYVRVFRHLGRFRAHQNFQGWLYRITLNVCRDAARKRRRAFVPLTPALEPAQEAGAEQALLEAERRAAVLEAIQSLTVKEREALVLRDLEGFSSEEVARLIGARPGTVRARIAAARSKVRSHCDRLFHRDRGDDR